MAGEACLVHRDLLEERVRVDVLVAGLDAQLGDRLPGGRGVQRALQRQLDRRAGEGDLYRRAGRRRGAQGQRLALDAVQQVHDAAVLQPGLVVEEATQLLRELRHRALGVLARLQPVVMHAAGAGIGVELGHRGQGEDLVEQVAELFLAPARQQEVPERAEAAALVGVGDGVALAHDLLEQRALAALPQRDALAHAAVELAEVVLDLAEVGEQLARALHELLEAVLDRGVVEQRDVAGEHARHLGVDLVALALQLGDAPRGVGFAALAHLLEQREEGEQARLGADELALAQLRQPGERLLGGRGEVELGLVGAGLVVLAQPGLVGRGPVVEVVDRRLGEGVLAAREAQRVELVLQRLGEVRRRHAAHVGGDEDAMQEARHQRRMVGAQQAPGGVVAAQGVEGGEVEGHGSGGLSANNSGLRSPDALSSVAVHDLVDAQQRQRVLQSLSDDQAIERIAVMEGQACDAIGVADRDGQDVEAIAGQFSIHERCKRFGQAVLADADLDCDFPVAGRADKDLGLRIADQFTRSARQGWVVEQKPQQGMGVEQDLQGM